MTTITVWLLISLGNAYKPTVVVERFLNQADCEQIQKVIRDGACFKATVVVRP